MQPTRTHSDISLACNPRACIPTGCRVPSRRNLAAAQVCIRKLSAHELRNAFAFFDKDGSDVITAIELAQGMQTLGYRGMTLDTWRERMAHVQDAKRNQAALNDWYMTFNEFVMAYEVHATSIDGAL